MEEPDFYWERGFVVFTEAFHRKRGYCCNSGCRHCPWRNEKGSEPSGGDSAEPPPDEPSAR